MTASNHIAQMNWGRLKHAPDAPELKAFMAVLDDEYARAAASDGFIWRIGDEPLVRSIAAWGYDDRMSATVSVWKSVAALKAYVFGTSHGGFLDRRTEWYEPLPEPRQVMWTVEAGDKPGFDEAIERLAHLRSNGPSEHAFDFNSADRFAVVN